MDPSLAALAESLSVDPISAEALTIAVGMVRGGSGNVLLKALIERRRNVDTFPFRNVMTTLERIISLNSELGMYLMCKLYPLAGKREHAVYDAIELWANDIASLEAIEGLERAARESGPFLRKRFETWARGARSRIGLK